MKPRWTIPPPITLSLREWSRYPLDAGTVPEGVTLPDDPATRELIQALDRKNKLRITELRRGIAVETTSWVGRITIGRLEITIQPKLSGLPLVRLLRYAYGLRHLDLETDAEFAFSARSFLDVLIYELAREAGNLIARGLRREYVRREADLSTPRGRIDMGPLARSGEVVMAALPCTFHERREDMLLNQVLRAGLLFAVRLTTDITLRARMRRLVAALGDAITPIRLGEPVFVRAERAISRLTAAYKPTLTLVRMLWENQGVSLDESDSRVELPGFLFDMNTFWQALLSRFLSEHLIEYRVENEQPMHGVFAYNPDFNPRRQSAPTPRPDFALWRGHELVGILDAKYRDLWATSLPSEWLYQLAIYATGCREVQTATMLYPTVGIGAQEARIVVQDPVQGRARAQVILRPVDTTELDRLLGAGGAEAARGRRTLALRLALGK